MSAEATAQADRLEIDPILRDGYEVHQAALRRGMNVLLLPRQVMMVRRPDGEGGELAFVHGVPSTSTLSAVTFAQDKRMRRAQLVAAGLPVPKGGSYSISNGVKDAKNLIKRIGYPVVIKPSMGDNMIEVHPGLRSEADVDEAIDYLRTSPDERPTYVKAAYALTLLGDPEEVDGRLTVPRGYRFLVEKHVSGQYLRFLVMNDEVRSVVLCPGGSGGAAHGPNYDVTEDVHPSLATMARLAVRAVAGLAVAAVDIVVADYRQDSSEQQPWIVELSERPWLAAQAAISDTLSNDLGDAILTAHAAQCALRLDGPLDEVTVELHIEGLTDAIQAATALTGAARRDGMTGGFEVADKVEGVVKGEFRGSPGSLARLAELLLDGQVKGHKAMLVDARTSQASPTVRSTITPERDSRAEQHAQAWTAEILSSILEGHWRNHPASNWEATRVATRRAGVKGPNTLFVAIDRETWLRGTGNRGIYATWKDTHDVVPRLGPDCVGAVVQRPINGMPAEFPQFLMANSYDAINTMARYAREQMTGTIVAVTGTVGKSTVKDLLSEVLANDGNVVATRGNENTKSGVPLTIANCITDPDYCVLEVAQSALWDPDGGVCVWLRPHIAVITEIGMTQARRVSSEEMTARIKARIARGIEPEGTAVLNRDMAEFDLARREVERHGAKVVTYGFTAEADVHAVSWELGERDSHANVRISERLVDVAVPMPGKGMLANALAALTVASLVGVDTKDAALALASFTLPELKLNEAKYMVGDESVTVIDDSHNAAYLSMVHAFEILSSRSTGSAEGRRIAVLGRMVDLGEKSAELHRRLAEPLRNYGIDLVITHGDEMKYLREVLPDSMLGRHCSDAVVCAKAIAEEIRGGDVVLIKGSRRASDFGNIHQEVQRRLS